MLNNNSAFSSFSIKDMPRAISFYRDVLGLDLNEQAYGFELNVSGTSIFIYPKEDHLPATFTVLNFYVTDLKAAVMALKVKGVAFESYNTPSIQTNEDDIFIEESMNMRIAWFTDPDSIILSLIEDNNPNN